MNGSCNSKQNTCPEIFSSGKSLSCNWLWNAKSIKKLQQIFNHLKKYFLNTEPLVVVSAGEVIHFAMHPNCNKPGYDTLEGNVYHKQATEDQCMWMNIFISIFPTTKRSSGVTSMQKISGSLLCSGICGMDCWNPAHRVSWGMDCGNPAHRLSWGMNSRNPADRLSWGMDCRNPAHRLPWGMDCRNPGHRLSWGMDCKNHAHRLSWGMNCRNPTHRLRWGMDCRNPAHRLSWGMDHKNHAHKLSWGMDCRNPADRLN